MATPAHELSRFQLPARIRAGKTAQQDGPICRELMDRIAGLPGTEVVRSQTDTSPSEAKAYLRERPDRRALGNPRSLLLCRVSTNGIAVHGLSNWARHQVALRGWGKLLSSHVLLFVPRDRNELETCLSIVEQAHKALTNPSGNARSRMQVPAWEMPKYSRTTLQ